MKKIKTALQTENLKAAPQVKQNLTAAFRAKHQSPMVLTLNHGIPLWQVAASLLLLIGLFSWLRPFEKETIVQAEPTIKIEEKIVTVTDTVFVEKIVEKPVIQYVELPSTTKTNIKQDVPMAYDDNKKAVEKVIYPKIINLESLIDNYYDTALVHNANRQIRGKSMGNSEVPTFEYVSPSSSLVGKGL
jgi:hypothetical protein